MAAWTHLAHDALSLPAVSVTWSSISASYDHLFIMASIRGDKSSYRSHTYLTFNASSGGTDYSETSLKAADTVVESGRETGVAFLAGVLTAEANTLADTFAASKVWIPHYANTANFKQVLVSSCVPNNSLVANRWEVKPTAGLWSSADAIDEITIAAYGGAEIVAYSTFDLYGILGV